jgi:DNA-binding MarR family transcriptional regulator
MSSIEDELHSQAYKSEQLKANINILYTANVLYNRMSSFLKPFNLTHEQFNVLRILRGKHPECMCQKDIQDRMVARQSNLTLIIKKLKEKELVTVGRSEVDRREHMISIASKGLELLSGIDEASEEAEAFQFGLSVSEAFHLNALLNKLRDELA